MYVYLISVKDNPNGKKKKTDMENNPYIHRGIKKSKKTGEGGVNMFSRCQ